MLTEVVHGRGKKSRSKFTAAFSSKPLHIHPRYDRNHTGNRRDPLKSSRKRDIMSTNVCKYFSDFFYDLTQERNARITILALRSYKRRHKGKGDAMQRIDVRTEGTCPPTVKLCEARNWWQVNHLCSYLLLKFHMIFHSQTDMPLTVGTLYPSWNWLGFNLKWAGSKFFRAYLSPPFPRVCNAFRFFWDTGDAT